MIIAIVLFVGVIIWGVYSYIKLCIDGEKMINNLHNSYASQRKQNDRDIEQWMYGGKNE